jgi:hypothetical protein
MRDVSEEMTRYQDNFEYNPLDLESRSIRLLQIIPAQDPKEQIQCKLRLASTVYMPLVCLGQLRKRPMDSRKRLSTMGSAKPIRLPSLRAQNAGPDMPESLDLDRRHMH